MKTLTLCGLCINNNNITIDAIKSMENNPVATYINDAICNVEYYGHYYNKCNNHTMQMLKTLI